jgi:hypothetical protein
MPKSIVVMAWCNTSRHRLGGKFSKRLNFSQVDSFKFVRGKRASSTTFYKHVVMLFEHRSRKKEARERENKEEIYITPNQSYLGLS